jgi:hypothetical protein
MSLESDLTTDSDNEADIELGNHFATLATQTSQAAMNANESDWEADKSDILQT